MSIMVTYCTTCTGSIPAFAEAIHSLQATYPEEIVVIDVECMAACDAAPSALVDIDFLAEVSIHDLHTHIADLVAEDAQRELADVPV